MNIDTFSTQLVQSLTARGIDEQTAGTYAGTLIRTLSEEDLREITEYRAPEDFAALSDSMAKLIREKTASRRPTGTADIRAKAERTETIRPTDVETRQSLGRDNLQHTKTGMRPVRIGGSTAVSKRSAEMEHTRIGAPVPGSEEQFQGKRNSDQGGLSHLHPEEKHFSGDCWF